MICPVCHTENDADARFCKSCGSQLEEQPREAQPEEQPAAPEEFDYNSYKRKSPLSSWAISLFFPAVVLAILLFSYLYVLVSE